MTSRASVEAMHLEPCPLCGAPGKGFSGEWAVCSNDGCEMSCEESAFHPTTWNTRPLESALRSRIAALEARNETLVDAIESACEGEYCVEAEHGGNCIGKVLTEQELASASARAEGKT